MSEKTIKKPKKKNYYECCICGKKMKSGSEIVNQKINTIKCLECGLGVRRVGP